MTKNEALKMAIEFMETLTIDVGIKTWNEKHRKETIKACEEALEQQDEYVFICKRCVDDLGIKYVEQPAQEPECSNHPDAPHGFCRDASHSAGRYVCECEGWEAEQLAPSWQTNKQFVLLSDDELDEIVDSLNVSLILDCSIADFVGAIEAKLKEKNHG